jgi:phosphate transport system substrate-binding protein
VSLKFLRNQQEENTLKKRYLFFPIIVLLGFLFLTGCGEKVTKVNVVGSTSVQPIAELLAENFMQTNRNISVNVQGGGSSAGIKAVLDGTAELGTSSRALTSQEKGAGLTAVEIALDGIAIVTNPVNKVNQLTTDQINKIFAGQVSNWSQLGGDNQPITVVNREEGSGTRAAFTELVMGQTKLTPNSIVQGSTGAVRQTVAGNSAAIGYISLASMDQSVKALEVNGTPCTVENIKAKKYPVVRPFLFLTKGQGSPEVKKFIDYVMGPAGQTVIKENGLVSTK